MEVRLGDWVAPVFAPGFPALANVRAFSADILVCADEPGTAFFLVVAANATQPSAAAVRRPDTYVGGTVHAHGRADMPAKPDLAGTMRLAEGLQDGAAYDVYVVAEDAGNADTARSSYWSAAPNLQNYPTRLALRTPDGTPPAFEGDGPAAFAAGATSFRLAMRLSEPVQVPPPGARRCPYEACGVFGALFARVRLMDIQTGHLINVPLTLRRWMTMHPRYSQRIS